MTNTTQVTNERHRCVFHPSIAADEYIKLILIHKFVRTDGDKICFRLLLLVNNMIILGNNLATCFTEFQDNKNTKCYKFLEECLDRASDEEPVNRAYSSILTLTVFVGCFYIQPSSLFVNFLQANLNLKGCGRVDLTVTLLGGALYPFSGWTVVNFFGTSSGKGLYLSMPSCPSFVCR